MTIWIPIVHVNIPIKEFIVGIVLMNLGALAQSQA